MRKISDILEELMHDIPLKVLQNIINKSISQDSLKINTGMKDDEADEIFKMCSTHDIFECNLGNAKKYLDKEFRESYKDNVKKLMEHKYEDSTVIDNLRNSQESPKAPDMSNMISNEEMPKNDEIDQFEWQLLKGVCKVTQKDPDLLKCVIWYSETVAGEKIYKCIVGFDNMDFDYDKLFSRVIL